MRKDVLGLCFEVKEHYEKARQKTTAEKQGRGSTEAVYPWYHLRNGEAAYELFRDKLPNHPLTLEDWVLAEKDLVTSMDADNVPK